MTGVLSCFERFLEVHKQTTKTFGVVQSPCSAKNASLDYDTEKRETVPLATKQYMLGATTAHEFLPKTVKTNALTANSCPATFG